MKPPQKIATFLMREHILWEWKHPHITLLPPNRQSHSMITDNKHYTHPEITHYIKHHLTTNPSI